MKIDGAEYCLYGKIDVWFPDRIRDIKTTRNYRGEESYLSTIQHLIYMHNERIYDFAYLVAEFERDEEEKSKKIVATHEIQVPEMSPEYIAECIQDRIKKAVDFLSKDTEMLDLYLHKFSQY